MSETQTQLLTDRWIPVSWQEYLQILANPLNDKAKSLLDDLGTKRSLYEDLNVSKYWMDVHFCTPTSLLIFLNYELTV
ncbi:hypothetical protein IQ259_23005 [Fortiea sp. LEGE XX443]|uniref:hypothetical protein n=1 Tax=Fortiea sp. LEGE XX443 TaxID=1828611 RepID=UPI00187EA04B|nr:hypothetical protein [Fortiea sp. LEGE XX443]MBE9007851.1 hypothetical protein [Fortiea sp. LEGE XX443]